MKRGCNDLKNDKTMKEIADILGVSKTTLFRYLKDKSIHETYKDGKSNMYDETTVTHIIQGFKREKDPNNVTDETMMQSLREQIYLLKKHNMEQLEQIEQWKLNDLEQKEQIRSLHNILDQQQKLLLYEQQKNTKLLEENIDKKRWWQWWKIK